MADDAPPPSYAQATLRPRARNGISPGRRRSMEDEARPLPEGWVRQFDPQHKHHFYVDTRASPPRSIWHHPYDDDDYLATLSSAERTRLVDRARRPNTADVAAESTDEEDNHNHHTAAKTAPTDPSGSSSSQGSSSKGAASTSLQPSAAHRRTPSSSSTHKPTSFGRKMKDKLTGTTHEQRESERARRRAEEEQAYAAHMAFRTAMVRAEETGQPQLVGRDRQGDNVYIEPSYGARAYGSGPQGQYVNPYSQGPYADPNARFIRPTAPYGRPYGPGYGGGLGLPIAGGLLGGALLGGLLF